MGAGGLRESPVTGVVWEMDTENGSGGDVEVSAVRETYVWMVSNPNLPTPPPCKSDIWNPVADRKIDLKMLSKLFKLNIK